jgi:hypothetical protein
VTIPELKAQGQPVKVKFYSGYKAEETPRAVSIEGEEYPIEEILRLKRTFNSGSKKMTESFEVMIEGKTFRLEETEEGEWLLSTSKKA